MKKYLVKYTERNGKEYYAASDNGFGGSWCLVSDIDAAMKWYGDQAEEKAMKRIHMDIKKRNDGMGLHGFFFDDMVTSEILVIEEPPKTYFELLHEIGLLRKDRFILKEFQKTMPNEHVEQKLKIQNEMVDRWDAGSQNSEKAKKMRKTLLVGSLSFCSDDDSNDRWFYLRSYYDFLKKKGDEK